ncbi:MAG: type 4a pilus biogenesis protein PilO [Planctomycetota bacterium]
MIRRISGLLLLTGASLVGCDDLGPEGSPGAGPAVSVVAGEATESALTQEDRAMRERLASRLLALDFFNEQMWPRHEAEAGLSWLRASAAGSGLELSRVETEPTMERQGVEIRPLQLKATGAWRDVVAWLSAVEASPRRLVLRGVELNQHDGHAAADLRVAVLVDRPTGLDALAQQDVASLSGEALREAVAGLEAELRSKSRAFTQLGAEASWSRPIAELTALMPADANPLRLSLTRTDQSRAQSFTGRFTVAVPDAGTVPGYVRRLQQQPGFVTTRLLALREAGAGWQRASLAFTYRGQPAATAYPPEVAEVETGR